jgi:hopene-associated glycosyltransferase HpnB
VILELIGGASLAIWLYLLLGRGGFWRGAERDDNLLRGEAEAAPGGALPDVIAVVPARDEAGVIARSIGSLLRQTYRGAFTVVLVDDGSSDGTGEVARTAAAAAGAADRLTVLRGSEPPPGWTGKLWAMQRGFEHVQLQASSADFVLFTDADIAYEAPDALETLVRGALARKTVLTSLMVKLRCDSAAEKILVPAFIFFFQKLYPFAWVNDPRRGVAAAAGGSMLVRRDALAGCGGLAAIRHALIDDCALGALLKRQGPIWLGLTERVVSLRPYPAFGDIRRMVTRSAYAELRYSPVRLAGAIAGMMVTYLAPPLLALFADGAARAMGIGAWAIMAVVYWPTLRAYGRSPAWALALPLVAATYTVFTIDSAIQHWRGRGGAWKGRFQAHGAVAP